MRKRAHSVINFTDTSAVYTSTGRLPVKLDTERHAARSRWWGCTGRPPSAISTLRAAPAHSWLGLAMQDRQKGKSKMGGQARACASW